MRLKKRRMLFEDFGDHATGRRNTAAMGLERFAADLSSHTACFEVVKGKRDFGYEASRVLNLPSRVANLENLNDLSHVLDARSKEHGAARMNRLDQIMPAHGHERATDEGDRCGCIERRELA